MEEGEESFADSFGKGVELISNIKTRGFAPETLRTSSLDQRNADYTKKPEEVSAESSAVKGKTTDSQMGAELTGVKSTNIGAPQTKSALLFGTVSADGSMACRLQLSAGVGKSPLLGVTNFAAVNTVQQITSVEAGKAVKDQPPAYAVSTADELDTNQSKELTAQDSENIYSTIPREQSAQSKLTNLVRSTEPVSSAVTLEPQKLNEKAAKQLQPLTVSKQISKTPSLMVDTKSPGTYVAIQIESPCMAGAMPQTIANGSAQSDTAAKPLPSDTVVTLPIKTSSPAWAMAAKTSGKGAETTPLGDSQNVTTANEGNAQTVPSSEGEKARMELAAKLSDDDQKQTVGLTATSSAHSVTESSAGIASSVSASVTIAMSANTAGVKAHADIAPHMGVGAGDQEGVTTTSDMGVGHRMLSATPTTLEVGLQSGTQGWLKIRAEMTSGGTVNASLSSATQAGQEMLHRELPALATYLQDEKVTVNSLVIHSPSPAASGTQFAGGTEGEGRGLFEQSGQQAEREGSQRIVRTLSGHTENANAYAGSDGVDENGLLSSMTYTSGGRWLNVRV
jgi:hypothetical protein